MAKLCVGTEDIKVTIKVAYPPGKAPEFTIETSGMTGEMQGGEPIPALPAAVLFLLGMPALILSWIKGPIWFLPIGWFCTVIGAAEFILWLFPPPY